MARLSEERRETVARTNVEIDFTLSLQRTVGADEAPVKYALLLVELDELAVKLVAEARQITEAAAEEVAKVEVEFDEASARTHSGHTGSFLDNFGSEMHLCARLTCTGALPRSKMYHFVKALLDFFDEHVLATIVAAERTKDLGALALAVSERLFTDDAPQLGDRHV